MWNRIRFGRAWWTKLGTGRGRVQRVHTNLGERDELLDWNWVNWMKEARLGEWNHGEWKQGLAGAQPVEELERIRRATRLGEPLGGEAFVGRLESR